jgi:hypothetical protein
MLVFFVAVCAVGGAVVLLGLVLLAAMWSSGKPSPRDVDDADYEDTVHSLRFDNQNDSPPAATHKW